MNWVKQLFVLYYTANEVEFHVNDRAWLLHHYNSVYFLGLTKVKLQTLTSSFVMVEGRWPAAACSVLNEQIVGNNPS